MDRSPWRVKLHLWLLAVSTACIAPAAAVADTILLDVTMGAAPGSARLTWAGDTPPFEIYAAPGPSSVVGQGNLLAITGEMEWIDGTAAAPIIYYVVIKSTVQLCGNSVRDGGEQCDDGNTTNLDGCDAACQFEQAQRASWFTMQFATDVTCTQNALGSAFVSGTMRNSLQTEINSSVNDGSFSLVLSALGATDLSGTNDPGFQLGVVSTVPETRGGTLSYNGASDLDWWHIVNPTSIDSNRQPVHALPATITAAVLHAGPGTIVIPAILLGGPGELRMSATRLLISTGASSTPLSSAAGDPPGHLVSENLDLALTSYAACGSPSPTASGKLCGNTSARSLAQVPIPAPLIGCGLFSCTQCYTSANTMLDVIVGGCTINLVGLQIRATQPDTVDPAMPPTGTGAPYALTWNTTTKSVTACRDSSNAVVDLNICLDAAAYSSFYRLATNRVIPK